MSHNPAVGYFGTQDFSKKEESEFNLDDVNFDAIEEKNKDRIDQQETPEVDDDCGDACKI